MKLQFKLAAAALAFVSVSSFAADLVGTDFVLATPTITDVATAAAAYDTATANDLTFTNSNAVIVQVAGTAGGIAIIDQTGPNFALIAQSGAQPSTAVIYQLAPGNAAAILQK
jgi:hypothetical protein